MRNYGYCCIALLVAVAAGLNGCNTPASKGAAFAAPAQLRATLTGPTDIELTWKYNATRAAGYFVEYQPEADDKYIIITALPPTATVYHHAHLLPRTRFVYRIVPFFGPASNAVEVKTQDEVPRVLSGNSEMPPASQKSNLKESIRNTNTFATAAPTDLRATCLSGDGVKLTWDDHASDADGYLVEVKPEWSGEFEVSAFLSAGTTSVTSYGFPPGKKFTFRVRAFCYGQASNLAEQTTQARK